MSSYLRPAIDSPVFRDDDNQVIDYGCRWPDSPPDDAYSVDRHPERFAPLHRVADALVADPRVEVSTTYPNGSSYGESRAEDFPADRLAAAMPVLAGRTGAWAPWPPRP